MANAGELKQPRTLMRLGGSGREGLGQVPERKLAPNVVGWAVDNSLTFGIGGTYSTAHVVRRWKVPYLSRARIMVAGPGQKRKKKKKTCREARKAGPHDLAVADLISVKAPPLGPIVLQHWPWPNQP